MSMKVTMGRIRVVRVPVGEAPFSVRAAWVGLELPCDPYLGYPSGGMERGVLSGQESLFNRCGVSVPQEEAIAILEDISPRAAAWWRNHGFPRGDERFGFAADEIEVLSGVTLQQLTVYTDEMQGNPDR